MTSGIGYVKDGRRRLLRDQRIPRSPIKGTFWKLHFIVPSRRQIGEIGLRQ
jgi:hypothetical protein